MEKERNHGKKYSILKRIKYYVLSQEKLEAHLLDYMQEHPELTPEPPSPPPGEFQKIMSELNRRGQETVVKKQLRILHCGNRLVNVLQKPLLIIMLVLIILAASSIGASAKKAHDCQIKVQNACNGSLEILKAEKIPNGYEQMKGHLGIRLLTVYGMLYEMDQ